LIGRRERLANSVGRKTKTVGKGSGQITRGRDRSAKLKEPPDRQRKIRNLHRTSEQLPRREKSQTDGGNRLSQPALGRKKNVSIPPRGGTRENNSKPNDRRRQEGEGKAFREQNTEGPRASCTREGECRKNLLQSLRIKGMGKRKSKTGGKGAHKSQREGGRGENQSIKMGRQKNRTPFRGIKQRGVGGGA